MKVTPREFPALMILSNASFAAVPDTPIGRTVHNHTGLNLVGSSPRVALRPLTLPGRCEPEIDAR